VQRVRAAVSLQPVRRRRRQRVTTTLCPSSTSSRQVSLQSQVQRQAVTSAQGRHRAAASISVLCPAPSPVTATQVRPSTPPAPTVCRRIPPTRTGRPAPVRAAAVRAAWTRTSRCVARRTRQTTGRTSHEWPDCTTIIMPPPPPLLRHDLPDMSSDTITDQRRNHPPR